MLKSVMKHVTVSIIAVSIALSCFITASAQTVSQIVTDFLSNMIVYEYAQNTEFSESELLMEIRRTVRGIERTGMFENITVTDDEEIELDWLTLFYITDWLFKELVLEVSFRHGDNGFYENSEHGYGYTFIGNGFTVEFPKLDEMDLITKAIENNIVDWNPVILADTSGVTEIGGFAVSEIRRLLSASGNDEPPDEDERTVADVKFDDVHELLLVILGGIGFIAGIVLFRQLRK